MPAHPVRPRHRARFSAAVLAAALVAGLAFAAAPAAQAAPATGTLDRASEQQNGGALASRGAGQVFRAGRSGQLTGADVNWYTGNTLGYTENDATTGTVSVYAGASASGAPIASGTISLQQGWQTVEFADPPVVTEGATYFLALPVGAVWYDLTTPPDGEGYVYGGRTEPTQLSANYRTYVLSTPAPEGLTAVGGDGTAALSGTAPAPPTDTTVTGYEAEWSVSDWEDWSSPVTSNGTAATITGLTNGTAYDFRVRATTDRGAGLWSTVATATPVGDFSGGAVHVSDPTPAVGKPVIATSEGWTPTPSLTWSWTVDGARVSTTDRYTPTPDDLGKQVQVTATANAPDRRSATRTADLGPVVSGTIVPGSVRVVAGNGGAVGSSVATGTVLTASLPDLRPANAATAYQWYRDSTARPIPGAVTAQYTVTGRDAAAGESVFVVASVASRGYTATTAASTAFLAVAGRQTGSVSTTAATVAEPVIATVAGWTPSDATVTFQWFDGPTAIPGATAATWTPTAAQAGHALHVVAIGDADGYLPYTVESAPVTVAEGEQIGTAALTGTPVVGTALSTSTEGWLAGTEFSYRWTRDGVTIDGATDDQYTPTAADLDAVVGVTVTGRLTGFTDRTARADAVGATAAGTQHARADIVETATPQVGGLLRASSVGWVDGTELSYRWLRDGTAVAGATGRTYSPVEADRGHVLRVEVTGVLAGWNALTVASADTRAVSGVPAAIVPENTLPRAATAGEPFRHHIDVTGSPAPTVTFDRALPRGLVFSGETGDITGTPTDAGHFVVRITATNGIGFPAVSVLTIDVAPGALDSLDLTTTGTGRNGDTVTAQQGSTIHVSASGSDRFGNLLPSVGEVRLTSSVASDEIDIDAVTFHHASPHVITATVGTVSASVTVEVRSSKAPTPVVTTPSTPSPESAAAPTGERGAGELAWTGVAGTGEAAVAAVLAVLLGIAIRAGVSRKRRA